MVMVNLEFESYPKIPRLFREVLITEKIDGTNAHIVVPENPDEPILAGSRNRYITPGKTTDNYDFAAFVVANQDMLRRLGPGKHYGEWYGCGIARKYGMTERKWALFNTNKVLPEGLPSNIHHVPILYEGKFDTTIVDIMLGKLTHSGSVAVPGFMDPEGIVVFHKAAGRLFKVTLGGDGAKGVTE
jgi:hypothetical protein